MFGNTNNSDLGGKCGDGLRTAILKREGTWPTPTRQDGKNNAGPSQGSGRKGNVPKFAQLNPDWVEWLMGWTVGWTDPKCDRPWPFLPLGADPADLPTTMPGYVPRTTMRREHRAARIRALGNGQVPQCASAAFRMGLELLGEPKR